MNLVVDKMTEKKDRKLEMKKKCAKEATKYVKDGMVLGVGSGSTVDNLSLH